jgi:TonB-dependent starch-binding outer membrane protein SusC
MKKLSLVLLLVLAGATAVMAQRTITGSVTDAEGEPLIGASILAQGTSTGTVTDIDGNYTLNLPEDTKMLVVSYTGFISQEVPVEASNTIDIVLEEDVAQLEEVVVTGYGVKRRKDVTGSISSVNSEEFMQEANVTVQSALRGRAAGVTVQQTSGAPGAGFNVRVRGATSVNASNAPLYVVDGIPIISGAQSQVDLGGQNQNPLADLNPNEIESIEVLKDASAAAIYGSRGANGVVLITTKSGSIGETKISFDASYGVQEPIKTIDIVDREGYRSYLEELFGSPDVAAGALPGDSNWQDLIFRQSNTQEYNLSASGGTEKTRFFTNLTYSDNEGIIDNTSFTRYSARLNLDNYVTDKLSFNVNIGFNRSNNQPVQNDNNIFGAVSTAILLPPTVPVRNEDGSFGSAFGLENPVAATTLYDQNIITNRVIGNMAARYKILPSLTFQAKLGIDALNLREDVFEPSGLQSSVQGTKTVATSNNIRIVNNYTLNFQKRFGRHSLNALAGFEMQEDRIEQTFSQVNDFPGDNFSALDAGASPQFTLGDFTGDNLRSFIGNVDYNFSDRYIFTFTIRRDGSSRFINDKWGTFPAASGAWRISEESFFDAGFINDLKIRAGWGVNGNNSIGNFTARQLSAAGANYQDRPGLVPTQLGNPDLKWETTESINLGIDFALFDNFLSGSVEYFNKTTDDLLFPRPIPTTSGFVSVPTNIGSVQNRGVDVLVSAQIFRRSDFKWNLTLNASYLENEVLSLFQNQPLDYGFSTRLAEGQPIGAFFGYVTDGIFQNEEEVEAHATQPGAAPGDFRFKDISGGAGPDGILNTADDLEPDGAINDADRTFIGKALPDWQGGVTSNMSYKGISLNFYLQYTVGNDIYNNNLAFAEGLNSVFAPTQNAFESAWREEGDGDDIPRIVSGDPANNRRDGDRFLEDGSFLRLKTATLAYTFPKLLTNRAGIERLRLYVTGTNLLTFTEYSWYDPEVNTFGNANVALGTDFLTFPQARSVVFGVNVGF